MKEMKESGNGMNRIIDQITVSNYTVLLFDKLFVTESGRNTTIDGKAFLIEIVFDLSNSIAIKGQRAFFEKEVTFD